MNEPLSSPAPLWSVSELNRAVKTLLERELPSLWVCGEISNLTIAASGHCYFSLKDERAQVRCVMFRNRALLLPFRLREGFKVEARAVVSLYEARGDYQLTIEAMRPAGLGALFEAFERLKAKLASEGLFANERKRALPTAPTRIGIITSRQAAALRDVLSTLKRRAPDIEVVLYPTPVQGADAAGRIAHMLSQANTRQEVDVLLLVRGGGSIEDLWSFNEEIVARAIAASTIPVVSGVGHETDFTIADFVADARAPTPTAAAELVSPDRAARLHSLQQYRARWQRSFAQLLAAHMQRLDFLNRRLIHPGERLHRQSERLLRAKTALQRAAAQHLRTRHWRLDQLKLALGHQRPDPARHRQQLLGLLNNLQTTLKHRLFTHASQLHQLQAQLAALNPEAVLSRGFSLVETEQGQLVRDAAQLRLGQKLKLHFSHGRAQAVVSEAPVAQGDLF